MSNIVESLYRITESENTGTPINEAIDYAEMDDYVFDIVSEYLEQEEAAKLTDEILALIRRIIKNSR